MFGFTASRPGRPLMEPGNTHLRAQMAPTQFQASISASRAGRVAPALPSDGLWSLARPTHRRPAATPPTTLLQKAPAFKAARQNRHKMLPLASITLALARSPARHCVAIRDPKTIAQVPGERSPHQRSPAPVASLSQKDGIIKTNARFSWQNMQAHDRPAAPTSSRSDVQKSGKFVPVIYSSLLARTAPPSTMTKIICKSRQPLTCTPCAFLAPPDDQ